MTRQTDQILKDTAFYKGNANGFSNPLMGSQFGYTSNPEEWLGTQAYVPRNLIPIVLETPRFFERMPNPELWITAWKIYFEKHCRVIEGLKAGLTVDVAEHAFGAAGEMFQEIVDVKRERSTLSTTATEKYGNVWQSFWERVITYGAMDPDTKTPLTATLDGGPEDNLADWYSGSIAFIEPDPTGKKVYRCWLSTNIFPQGTGPIEGKMDKTSSLSVKELSLEFNVLSFYGAGTRALGQELLDGISKQWANPQLRKSFIKEVHADVAAIAKGYKESVESVATNRVGDII
jgi:hypothetical protein